MHLEGWAVDGRIRVVEVDSKKTWVTTPLKAGRRTDFYSLSDDDVSPDAVPPLLFETVLGRVESEAADGLRTLRTEAPNGQWIQYIGDPKAMVAVGDFIAFQAVRGLRHRRSLSGTYTVGYKLMYEELTDRELLRSELSRRLERPPTEPELDEHHKLMCGLADGTITVSPADAAATGEIGAMAQEIRNFILHRNWRVQRTSKPLVCSDEPVLLLGGPGTPRTEVAGFATAAIIAFPLDPFTVLVMYRPDLELVDEPFLPLDPIGTRELNRELIANAELTVYERPDDDIGARIVVPRWPSTMDTESGYTDRDDPEAEVIRHFKRTRWANTSTVPSWPVDQWWACVKSLPALQFPRRNTWSLSNLQGG